MRFRFFDAVVFILTAAVTIFCAVRVYSKHDAALRLVVRNRENTWVYPADRECRIDAPGPLGITAVQLNRGTARVLSSPCTNQNCLAAGTIHSRGQWIACLPNGVFVSLEAEKPVSAGRGTGADLDGAAW